MKYSGIDLHFNNSVVTVTDDTDLVGTHSKIAQAIRDKEVDDVLAVKDNQPKLAEPQQ